MTEPNPPELAALNDEQRFVVDLWDRSVLVMAPVGTGKTRVLSLRAARAIERGHAAASLLCLSFTNKAAREMRQRLSAQLGKGAAGIAAQTFHGLCALILRAEAETLGLDSDFLIYDEQDSAEIWGRLLRRHNLALERDDYEKAEFLFQQAAEKARLSRYNDPEPRSSQQVFEHVARGAAFHLDARRVKFPELLRDYVHELRENHALDFTDLILGVNRLWDESPTSLSWWQQRFDWIQVDEVQDTSRAEYRVLRMLAARHRQLSLFGDIDQTIYEWRGSAPFDIVEQFKREFSPVEAPLVRNYRSTRAILEACAAVVRRCPGAVTKRIVPQQAEQGEAVAIVAAAYPVAEAEWIAGRIQALKQQHGLAWRDFAVLVRTNFTARDISEVFTRLRLPHIQVEQQRFFQRAEIKAALSYLRLLENRHDGHSLMRFLKTPAKGIGEAALNYLAGAPREAGLRLGDLLEPGALQAGDPLAPLLEAWAGNRIIVFDTETTGLDTQCDEIVELAAVRCGAAGVTARYHALLRPARPVGGSARIHGWSDEHLAAHGRASSEVMGEFAAFAGGCLLAGHNVAGFDIPILEATLRRAGVPLPAPWPVLDTLDLTRRFHRLPRYRLADIAASLGLAAKPTHKAADDVAATAELLALLVPSIEKGAAGRRAAVARYLARFSPLATQLAAWRAALEGGLRPPDLLDRILDEAGLLRHYAAEDDGDKRLDYLGELVALLRRFDNPAVPARASLVQALNLAALGSDVERQAAEQDRVLILTAHQSKGLEFDTVFVAHATDDDFPSRRSQREGRQDEEHRLFYVALSRARRRLFITWPRYNKWHKRQTLSRYAEYLRDEA